MRSRDAGPLRLTLNQGGSALPSSPVCGAAVKPNGLATHVELPAEGLRTRVRFSPPPPAQTAPLPGAVFFYPYAQTDRELTCPQRYRMTMVATSPCSG